MSVGQRAALMIGAVVVAGMVMFPPWERSFSEYATRPIGYHPIFDPPKDVPNARVDMRRLGAQLGATVLIVTAFAFVLAEGDTATPEKEQDGQT